MYQDDIIRISLYIYLVMKKTISFIFGPNGAGKGTLARHIAESFDYYHLNTGNTLRDWVSAKRRFDVLDQIDAGEFVDDTILREALEEKFAQVGHVKKILADGVPRKLSQVSIVQEICKKFRYEPEFIIVMSVALEVLLERVKDRVIAPDGHVYHMTLNPPPKHFKLSELHARPDDRPDIVRKRYEYYSVYTLECLSDHFFKNCQISSIDATQSIPQVFSEAEDFINGMRD